MSGIYGMIRCDGGTVSPEILTPMADGMSFWGPDGHGQWCAGPAGLGHLMLHVTPESLHEKLPNSLPGAPHLVITGDARIDNRDELLDALGMLDQHRSQLPDSQVILAAYERWGHGCVNRLLGDFAFAIWNGKQRTLFCARDVFGCKPFVYHHDARRFVFASDIRGVLPAVAAPVLNEPLLAAYLQMKTYHAEKRYTFFRDIVKLPPAHTLTLTDGQVRLAPYWSAEDTPDVRLPADEDYEEQMRSLFAEAVGCRLRSAFPIGSHISGGLDSSSISIMAARSARVSGGNLPTLLSYAPPPVSERPDAALSQEQVRIRAVCRQEFLTCIYLPPTVESLTQSFRRDPTVEPHIMLAREANVQLEAAGKGIRVILSGWGGDEATTYPASNLASECVLHNDWQRLLQTIQCRTKSSATMIAKARSIAGLASKIGRTRLPDVLYGIVAPEAYMRYRPSCIDPAFAQRNRIEVAGLRGPTYRALPGIRSSILRRLEIGHLSLRAEHWATSGARHAIEYRYPMLDRRIVEFIMGVPVYQLFRHNVGRSFFRRAIGDVLPTSAGWMTPKIEGATFDMLRGGNLRAHQNWYSYLIAERSSSPATQLVSLRKCKSTLNRIGAAPRVMPLSGVTAAYQCFGIQAIL